MSTEAPDPRTFKSWEDAFAYPVPVVRKLEQQLRNHANENREKLRSLVGASYRDLLGTAERIIEMDEQMQRTENILGQLGQKCNARVVKRISGNYEKVQATWNGYGQERNAFAAQVAVLQACPIVISRCLKRPSSLLLAAKVLVIARLLHKNLSALPNVPPLVEKIRGQLGHLRQKLLNKIDKHLANPSVEVSRLVQIMCAFTLATSSTPTDVLKHFHHVRMESISGLLKRSDRVQERILEALQLCVRTLQDTQNIFPKRLADSLAKLKAAPLLRDPEVSGVIELNLDIHARWISDEVRNYTPWPRHDQLQKPEADRLLKAWAKQAITAFVQGSKGLLADVHDLPAIVALRKQLLETWFSTSGRAPGLDSAAVLDNLRELLNARLMETIRNRCNDLSLVSSNISKVLDTWQDGSAIRVPVLWDSNLTSMDISDGAAEFKKAVINGSCGRSATVLGIISTFERWVESVLEIRATLKDMKESRWDDIYEDEDDEEFGLDSKQALLGEDDPRLLEETLAEALTDAFSQLKQFLADTTAGLVEGVEDRADKTVFLLRSLREISQRLPSIGIPVSDVAAILNIALVEPLHRTIAHSSLDGALSSYETRLQKTVRSKRPVARALWEGNPPLPAQPTPATFRFLSDLTKSMARLGSDLWAPSAVRVLKWDATSHVARILRASLDVHQHTEPQPPADGLENGPTEGGEETEANEGQSAQTTVDTGLLRKEHLTQLLFDALYLQRALGVTEPELAATESIDGVLGDLADGAGIDGAARERLSRHAADYWKKTYLLFALLA